MKKIVITGFFVWGFFLSPRLIFGSEILSSADLYSAGSFSVSLAGLQKEEDISMKIGGPQTIQIPVSGGNSTIFSETNTEIDMESECSGKVFRFSFRPRDGLLYFAKVGQIQDFSLTYSSGSFTNAFFGNSDGFLWGAGIRWNLTQDTPVSAAIAMEFSYTESQIGIDGFKSGSVSQAVRDKFEQDEFQGAINFSKRFKMLQPYCGLKLMRVVSKLKDCQTKEKISGANNLVSPFVGLQWEVFPKEFFVVEVSFVDEKMVSGGFNITF